MDFSAQVRSFVTDAGRGQDLPSALVRTVESPLFGNGGTAAEEQGHLVCVFELVEDLPGGFSRGFVAGAVFVDGGHACGIIQNDGHDRTGTGTEQRRQASECGRGQADGDQHKHGRADEHQEDVVNSLFAAGFLYADLQEP